MTDAVSSLERMHFTQLIQQVPLLTWMFRRKIFSYPFMFTPIQLVFLAEHLREATKRPGCIVEAGVAYGATTNFLAQYLQQLGSVQPYIAIDTFSGFPPEHSDYEVRERGKRASIRKAFRTNSRDFFETGMRMSGVKNVRIIQSDVTKVDFASLGPISFCILDVDLYLPIKDVLPKLNDALSPGGLSSLTTAHREDSGTVRYKLTMSSANLAGSPRRLFTASLE